MKNIRIFYLEIFPFLVVKFSIYLNRRVFVMISKYKSVIYKNMHEQSLHEKYPNLDHFKFSKNVIPPSYINKIQLLYDKYLHLGYFFSL